MIVAVVDGSVGGGSKAAFVSRPPMLHAMWRGGSHLASNNIHKHGRDSSCSFLSVVFPLPKIGSISDTPSQRG